MIPNIIPEWLPEAIRFECDHETGAEVEQLTSQPVTSMNIYCEQRFASADGSRIAISRTLFGQPEEIWICDLPSLKLCKAVTGNPLGATSTRDAVYYTALENNCAKLMALNLVDFNIRELFCFHGDEIPKYGAVSPDEKYFICGPFVVGEDVYSLKRVNLHTKTIEPLCEQKDMFNPHIQFGQSGTQFIIQINRGGKVGLSGGRVGKLGATLSFCDAESGEITTLPVGRPHTPSISGHECWVADTGRILFTAGQYKVSKSSFVTLKEAEESEKDMPPAAIYSVAKGEEKATIVATGLLFNHLAASDDGRFFIADDHTTGRIYIGSIKTGRYLGLCESRTRQGTCQYSHVHPYMTPDNKYVIFNSIATGCAQVYAACIPDGFLDRVTGL